MKGYLEQLFTAKCWVPTKTRQSTKKLVDCVTWVNDSVLDICVASGVID